MVKQITDEEYSIITAKRFDNREEKIKAIKELYASVPKMTTEQKMQIEKLAEDYLQELIEKHGRTDNWPNYNPNSMQSNFEFMKIIEIAEEVMNVNSEDFDRQITHGIFPGDYMYPFGDMISNEILSPLIEKLGLENVLYD